MTLMKNYVWMLSTAGIGAKKRAKHGLCLTFEQKNGANSRNRTGDLFITSELLYRLSYVGITFLNINPF